MSDVWAIKGRGEFNTDVVGESHYENELNRILGSEREATFTASLVPEPANPYDSNAVAVYEVGHGKVGHLDRETAAQWQPVLREIKDRFGVTVTCDARAGGRHDGPIGVTLDIELEDVEQELESRSVGAEKSGAASQEDAAWMVRRGDEKFPVRGIAQLQEWARAGRILPSDYVFNPVLTRWMYARDAAELAPIFAESGRQERASRGTSKAGLGLLFGGIVIGYIIWWPAGIITSVVGVLVIVAHALSRSSRSAARDFRKPIGLTVVEPVVTSSPEAAATLTAEEIAQERKVMLPALAWFGGIAVAIAAAAYLAISLTPKRVEKAPTPAQDTAQVPSEPPSAPTQSAVPPAVVSVPPAKQEEPPAPASELPTATGVKGTPDQNAERKRGLVARRTSMVYMDDLTGMYHAPDCPLVDKKHMTLAAPAMAIMKGYKPHSCIIQKGVLPH